jgi:hypothetical protein
MNKKTGKYWKTTDLYLAAFLFAKGETIVGIEATTKSVVFTFLDPLTCGSFYLLFQAGGPLIDARIYACAIKTLKSKALDSLMECHG